MTIRTTPCVLLLKAAAALFLIWSSFAERPPRLVWNASASVPIGLYALKAEAARVGDIVALRLPRHVRRQAGARRYLPANALLLKPVAAASGDRVCRWQTRIHVNGRFHAEAARHDTARRRMPVWQGCRHLHQNEIFVLSPSRASFDSRYFGPIHRDAVVAPARPVWTF